MYSYTKSFICRLTNQIKLLYWVLIFTESIHINKRNLHIDNKTNKVVILLKNVYIRNTPKLC